MTRIIFGRDYSLAHTAIAVSTMLLATDGYYLIAAANFFVGIALCVWGELRLERAA